MKNLFGNTEEKFNFIVEVDFNKGHLDEFMGTSDFYDSLYSVYKSMRESKILNPNEHKIYLKFDDEDKVYILIQSN